MPDNDEEMTLGEQRKYVQRVQARYWLAMLGRRQRRMEVGFRRLLDRLPFAVRELHPDNGSELLAAAAPAIGARAEGDRDAQGDRRRMDELRRGRAGSATNPP